MSKIDDTTHNVFEISQERTENRTAYFRVPKDMTLKDLENYITSIQHLNTVEDYFPEWCEGDEDDFVFDITDRDSWFGDLLINNITVNDDKTKLLISNRYGETEVFRDLTSCPGCGADKKHSKKPN